MQTNNLPDLLTEKEVAQILRITYDSLRRCRRLGTGPVYIQPAKRRRIFYRRSDIEDYMNAGLNEVKSMSIC
jgi:predicted site-specific integrase-resolvase